MSSRSILRTVLAAVLVAAGASGLPCTAATNLVADPSFESPPFAQYNPGPIGDGWSVVQGRISIMSNYQLYTSAHSGEQFADLDSSNSVNELGQTLATVAGRQYDVSFWLSDDVGGDPLTVELGSTVLFNGSTPHSGLGVYDLFDYHVVATGNSSLLSFTSQYAHAGGSIGAVIDDVSVAPLPEPATLALLGAAAVGLLGYGWSRRRMARGVFMPHCDI